MNLGHQAVSLADTHLLVCKEWTLFAFGTRGLRPLLCLSERDWFFVFFCWAGVAKVEICSGDDATKNSKNRSFMVKCGLYPRSLKFRYRFLRGKLLVCRECFILILKGFRKRWYRFFDPTASRGALEMVRVCFSSSSCGGILTRDPCFETSATRCVETAANWFWLDQFTPQDSKLPSKKSQIAI